MEDKDPLVIALLPEPEDLERAREGWYRVPLEHTPASLAQARALAFYQPASFGEARWRVEWWAPLHRLDILRRIELIPGEPDHPRAHERYACARLGPLEAVEPAKLSATGRRLLFITTTWGAFHRAPDLDTFLARHPRPIRDDPLYRILQQQLDGKGGIPDPDSPHQRRLLEGGEETYDALDW